VDDRALTGLLRQIGPRPTWAAISTHEGEEMVAVEIHHRLRQSHDGLLTIVVPRHPGRAAGLAAEFESLGLKVIRRSTGDRVRSDTDVYLGDTIGEMGLYLRLAEIAFVGRSLTSAGGQNPLEPAMLDTAVLSGSKVQNFREVYKRLVDCGGARIVRDGEELASAVDELLLHADLRRAMAAAGAAAVADMRGALARTQKALEPYIHPLVVKSRLRNAGER
jgi:3-deoxy-D-manno-octulosonic-acid transferase